MKLLRENGQKKENHPEEELIRGVEILLARIEKLKENLGPSEETVTCPLCGAKSRKGSGLLQQMRRKNTKKKRRLQPKPCFSWKRP